MSKRTSPILLVTVGLLSTAACKPTLPPDSSAADTVDTSVRVIKDAGQDTKTGSDATVTSPDAAAKPDTMVPDGVVYADPHPPVDTGHC